MRMKILDKEKDRKKSLKQQWLRISPKLMSDTKLQIHEVQRTSGRVNVKEKITMPKYNVTFTKYRKSKKNKSWKKPEREKSKEKQRITSNFPTKPCKQEETEILKMLRDKLHQLRILNSPYEIILQIDKEIHSQKNKNWGNLLPVGLPYNNLTEVLKKRKYSSETEIYIKIVRLSKRKQVKD